MIPITDFILIIMGFSSQIIFGIFISFNIGTVASFHQFFIFSVKV